MDATAQPELAAFANAIAHRLTTPARIVAGNLRILDARLDRRDPEAAAALAAIGRGAGSIAALVDGLIRYARVGDPPEERRLVDAAAEARCVIAGLADEIASTGAVVSVGALPAVRAEPRALRTLFSCLLDNAVRAGGERPPRITVDGAEEPSAWRLTISDDGVGVGAADRERVFEPLVSIRNGGTGLGLTLARAVVRRHGGEIWLHSGPAGGTTVHVVLPRDERPEGEAPR